ncbi:splicing factor, arginine/serine-rich 19-like [Musca vetustissima]|uniref:splicing factor, arginine/serine-rich 19-like n=1 Tax=Musca vetustissima TaxID=27455 RepID=UPI002AB74C15|nr:splicing factor, arginine/serine-rich 19-like [Musca vetustissima]
MLKKFLIVFLAVAICFAAADPIRQKPLRRRVSARQEVAPPTPAPTGYPPAGVTPEIPFELPTETEKPEPQPDEVYGPPEPQEPQPDEVYGPPETTETNTDAAEEFPQEQAPEEEVVVPVEEELEEEAEAEDVDEVEEEVLLNDDGTVIAVSTSFDQGEKPARLVYQRFPQRRQPPASVPARLRLAKIRQPAAIVYTTRYQRL